MFRRTAPWLGLLARLVVGGVWLAAGVLKVSDPEASVAAVRAYQLLPRGTAEVVGHVLPMLEIVVGACLVVGLLTRLVGGVSALLQVAFVIGIVSVWARGIEISCGCFGNGGPDPHATDQYPWEVARDVGLLALSIFLVARRSTPLALDAALFPPTPTDTQPEPTPSSKQEPHAHAES